MSERMNIVCPACNYENAEGSSFCNNCGYKLVYDNSDDTSNPTKVKEAQSLVPNQIIIKHVEEGKKDNSDLSRVIMWLIIVILIIIIMGACC